MLVMLSLILAKVHLATRMDSGRIYSKTLLQIVKDGTCSPVDINGRNYQQRIHVSGVIYFVLISCEFRWYLGFSSHRQRAVGLTIANILFVRFARVRWIRFRMHQKIDLLLFYPSRAPYPRCSSRKFQVLFAACESFSGKENNDLGRTLVCTVFYVHVWSWGWRGRTKTTAGMTVGSNEWDGNHHVFCCSKVGVCWLDQDGSNK